MENASKALLIAGAILLCILIIAIGMFIYNSANENITDAVTGMSGNQIEAFNATFTNYEGTISGSQVKSLMGKLLANADTYKDEPTKIPAVFVDKVNNSNQTDSKEASVPSAGNPGEYIDAIGVIRNRVETKHEYYVEMNYQANGLIDYIIISYNPSTPVDSTTHTRDS